MAKKYLKVFIFPNSYVNVNQNNFENSSNPNQNGKDQ